MVGWTSMNYLFNMLCMDVYTIILNTLLLFFLLVFGSMSVTVAKKWGRILARHRNSRTPLSHTLPDAHATPNNPQTSYHTLQSLHARKNKGKGTRKRKREGERKLISNSLVRSEGLGSFRNLMQHWRKIFIVINFGWVTI